MLRDLVVRNFAIIRHFQVSFHAGLNVLTGETGAGKSILVGAVNLILGSRASQEMIRTGADEATVEAVFSVSDHRGLKERLDAWGMDAGDEVVIRRSINRSGRNRVFVNGQLAALQQLQQLAEGLISISGQHEHQLLLDADRHLGLLDSFGGLEPLCRETGGLFSEWSETKEELRKLRRYKQEQSAHIEWVRFQLHELEGAALKPDEDALLEQERNLLKHAATLIGAAESSHQALYAGRGAILEQLAVIEKNLDTLKRIDPTQSYLSDHLEQGRIQLEELAHALQQYVHRISFDPQRLAAVEERLATLHRLGKKFGGSVEAMLQRIADLRSTLGEGEGADLREEEMEKRLARLRDAYLEKAAELSERRREAAARLSEEVEKTLQRLDMPRARFSVGFGGGDGDASWEPPFKPTGIDEVEFLLSANPGEALKPLNKVASGGELSRILLALKSLLSTRGEAETLLFDEVDAGIGGRTAELVGIQLKDLAGMHQVVCITHLPQIACYGDCHYQVSKKTSGDETVSSIRILSDEERVEELARMLGGISISEKTRDHARELLQKRKSDV